MSPHPLKGSELTPWGVAVGGAGLVVLIAWLIE